ncbi:MAG TPA: hypothetical protein VMU51_01645 [Mycobacteriales bacterium]|nr:hypothetical protein [Mycobacteriales bacterium]
MRAIGVWELVPAHPYPVPLDGDLRDYAAKALDAAVRRCSAAHRRPG